MLRQVQAWIRFHSTPQRCKSLVEAMQHGISWYMLTTQQLKRGMPSSWQWLKYHKLP